MIEIEMSKDVQDFSPTVISALTRRNLVCLAIGAAYTVPLVAFLGKLGLSVSVLATVAAIAMVPAVACGWVKMYGMSLEKFAFVILQSCVLAPQKRRYVCENSLSWLDPEEKAGRKKKRLNMKQRKKQKEDLAEYEARA